MLMKTITLFAKERVVVMIEFARNEYTSIEYILSKVIAELPLDILVTTAFTAALKFSIC